MLAVLVAASLALMQQTDTSVAVQQGARLEMNNFGGEIVVRTWNQNRVRVQAVHSSRDRIEVSARGNAVRVHAARTRGMAHLVDYTLTVPTWMPVELSGISTHIVVDGVQADIRAETVEGNVTVTGGSGNVSLSSVEGTVVVSGTRGRLKVTAVDGNVWLTDVAADISVDAVDGDIVIRNAQSSAVDANTVDGTIYYVGTIRDGGRYRLATHDGALTVAIPEGTGATIGVASFSGDFEASFPVQLQSLPGRRRFSFTLGNGGARIELETFDGRIFLRRPGEVRTPEPVVGSRQRERHRNRDQ